MRVKTFGLLLPLLMLGARVCAANCQSDFDSAMQVLSDDLGERSLEDGATYQLSTYRMNFALRRSRGGRLVVDVPGYAQPLSASVCQVSRGSSEIRLRLPESGTAIVHLSRAGRLLQLVTQIKGMALTDQISRVR